jgi:hypothetical protein
VNGLINGERAQGDLNAVLTTNDQGKSRITVTGDLALETAGGAERMEFKGGGPAR